MNDSVPPFFRYWGKADKDGSYHLLPYHCLDVAAMAKTWWNESPTIRKAFPLKSVLAQKEIQAWVLFFIALHDIGKLDIRFQR
jgi:CRISPR-associated endonuclease/helicase Cas3